MTRRLILVPGCAFPILMAAFIATAVSDLPSSDQCVFDQPDCGLCGPFINVTLIVRNVLLSPYFEYVETIIREPKRPLLYFLEKAADVNRFFKFSATYFAKPLGFFINTINHVPSTSDNDVHWAILSVINGCMFIPCGVSNYVPNQYEVILFNLTTWETKSNASDVLAEHIWTLG